jgi:thiamine biosynthesis protein ThiS
VITIHVNGHATTVEANTTVRSLLTARGLSPDKVAVERNRRLLKSERYDEVLNEGDQVEIVTFVGGG